MIHNFLEEQGPWKALGLEPELWEEGRRKAGQEHQVGVTSDLDLPGRGLTALYKTVYCYAGEVNRPSSTFPW